jgi:hypothetical protein
MKKWHEQTICCLLQLVIARSGWPCCWSGQRKWALSTFVIGGRWDFYEILSSPILVLGRKYFSWCPIVFWQVGYFKLSNLYTDSLNCISNLICAIFEIQNIFNPRFIVLCYYTMRASIDWLQHKQCFQMQQENGRTVRLCPSLWKTTIVVVYFAHASP